MSVTLSVAPRVRRHVVVRAALGSWAGAVGAVLVLVIVLIAVVGPLVSPSDPTATVGIPFQAPAPGHLLGMDALGRDAFSRYLNGGRALVVVAFLATALAYLIAIPLGMASGYRRGLVDLTTVGVADLILSFPPIVFVLVLLAAAGPRLSIVVAGIAIIHMPRVVRIARAVAIDVAAQEFVEAAVARGEGLASVLWRDLLPNVWTPILADFGIRLTGSVILFSSLSYLGLGQAPPAADWGLMISENRAALLVQPWVVVAPALTIALLAIGVNLMADAVAHSLGRSLTGRSV